jgi:hypothetical protein
LASTLIAAVSWLMLGQVTPGPVAGEPTAQRVAPPAVNQPLDAPATPAPAAAGYAGVAGPEAASPFTPPRSDPPRLVWTGFKMAGDRSELFLQTTRPVSYEVSQGEGKTRSPKLTVFLRNCRIHLKNNGRRLDTRFFATPVEEVSARQRRKDVAIQIALEAEAVPTARTEAGPDGTHFLVLSFPPGRAQPATAPANDEGAQTAPR